MTDQTEIEALPRRWSGWPSIVGTSGLDGWIDLTHPFGTDLPYGPKTRRVASQPDDLMNITHIETIVHAGTHLDAPSHFFEDGPSIDEIPLDRLQRPGVVWAVDVQEEGVIGVDALERSTPPLEAGDIVLIQTGFARFIHEERYKRHPSLSPEAARWIVSRKATMVVCDFLAPELPLHLRPPGYDFPVHRILLGSGVLIVENAGDASALGGQRVEVLVVPLPILGADGSPVRLLVRPHPARVALKDDKA